MNIAIIGTGNVGGALAKGWAKAGHQIYLGVNDQANFKGKALLEISNISVHSIPDAVKHAEVVLLAAVPTAVIDIVKSMGTVANKVLIDAMHSVRAKPEGYNNTFEALTALTADAEIVKCFNTTGFENMANPVYPNGLHIDMFMAGDSKIAKEIASHLAKDLGFENCYDFGGSDKVALLEQLVLIWINMAMSQGLGRNFAFKIVKR